MTDASRRIVLQDRPQSLPNSAIRETCPLARPITMPNFIALRQTVYKKSVTIFKPFSILAPHGTPWAKVHQSGTGW